MLFVKQVILIFCVLTVSFRLWEGSFLQDLLYLFPSSTCGFSIEKLFEMDVYLSRFCRSSTNPEQMPITLILGLYLVLAINRSYHAPSPVGLSKFRMSFSWTKEPLVMHEKIGWWLSHRMAGAKKKFLLGLTTSGRKSRYVWDSGVPLLLGVYCLIFSVFHARHRGLLVAITCPRNNREAQLLLLCLAVSVCLGGHFSPTLFATRFMPIKRTGLDSIAQERVPFGQRI